IRRDESVISLALRSWFATRHATAPLLLLTDVTCTGSAIREFVLNLPKGRDLSLVTFVDARADDTPYFPIQTAERTVDVKVDSVVRDYIHPIRKKPDRISAREILVIDHITNTPTRYALPEASRLTDDVIVKRVVESGALAAGHFVLGQQHYVYY